MLIQRVKEAKVRIRGETVGNIGQGLLVFVGIGREDSAKKVREGVGKAVNLRIFENEQGKFDKSLFDIGGAVLVVSQFTLYGDCRKGRRPSFDAAAPPQKARELYELFLECLTDMNIPHASGKFGEKMEVELVNDGPVTIWMEV